MKVVILCGGEGIRLKMMPFYSPKGLVYLDDKPIIWHVMKRYSLFGHNEFILALGKNGDKFRDYFLNYNLYTNDIEICNDDSGKINYFTKSQEDNWKIMLVNTGEQAGTGARVSRLEKYITEDIFLMTYSDCLCDVNIDNLISYHKKNKKTATVTGVLPPFRYGEFIIKNEKIVGFNPISKLKSIQGYVNGGFAIFNKTIFKYLSAYNECVLEGEVYKKLIEKDQLRVYKHDGFWQCLDNDREFNYLKKLCEENKRYWLQE